MNKFEFSLQKILDLRNFEKQQAEADLGKTIAEIEDLKKKLEAIAAQRVNINREQKGNTDFSIYSQTSLYFSFLKSKEEEYLEQIAQKEIVAEQKRDVLREAMKKVKSLENLRDRKKEEWKSEQNRLENKQRDEVVTFMTYSKINEED